MLHITARLTCRGRQNGRHLADDISKCNLLKGNVWRYIQVCTDWVNGMVPKGWRTLGRTRYDLVRWSTYMSLAITFSSQNVRLKHRYNIIYHTQLNKNDYHDRWIPITEDQLCEHLSHRMIVWPWLFRPPHTKFLYFAVNILLQWNLSITTT